MSSSITILLFWYVVPLSENQTLPAPGKEEIIHACRKLAPYLKFNVVKGSSMHRYLRMKAKQYFYLSIGLLWVSEIGASMSEPYSSMITCTCVSLLVATGYKFQINVFKYFTKIEHSVHIERPQPCTHTCTCNQLPRQHQSTRD